MAVFLDKNEKPINIEGLFSGQSCFLVLSGPSLNNLDLTKLRQPGIITFGVNNSPVAFRPNMWVSVDTPGNFVESIWRDPQIMKFCMIGKRQKVLYDSIHWRDSKYKVIECPNMYYYKDNEEFEPKNYLTEDTVNWGNHSRRCENCGHMKKKDEKKCPKCGVRSSGKRSVMLAAIKIIYRLGFKRLFIVGADFNMNENNKYAFDQDRSSGSITGNNKTYERLNERFKALKPVFEQNKFYVFNATAGGNLNTFNRIGFNDAVDIALKGFPDPKKEQSFGMYDKKSIRKDKDKYTEKIRYNEEKAKITKDENQKKHYEKKVERYTARLNATLEREKKVLEYKK